MKILSEFKAFFTIATFCCSIQAFAQPSIIQQTTYQGDINATRSSSMLPTDDGGFLLLGGDGDVLLIKVDSTGTEQWRRRYGGSKSDEGESIIELADGRYAILATSNSTDGDVIGNHGNGTTGDFWLLIINRSGELLMSKCFGGTLHDEGYSLAQKPNGNLVLCGYVYSNDGHVSGNHSTAQDAWLVEVDLTGAVQWQRCYGGTASDLGMQIRVLPNNKLGFCSMATSNNGDVSVGANRAQYWMVITDFSGNILRHRNYGGTSPDVPHNFIQTSDGGYVLIGLAFSSDGQVIGNMGGIDMWVIKLDSALTLQWQKPLGGSGGEDGFDVLETSDGGFLCIGSTSSHDGHVTGVHGDGSDLWIVKLNYAGNLIWQKAIGGSWGAVSTTPHRGKKMIHIASEGSIYVLTTTQSNDGDVTDQTLGTRFWFVRLKDMANQIKGQVYYDLNTNSTFDGNDVAAGNRMVFSSSGEATFTNADGTFSLGVSGSGTYNVDAPVIPYHTPSPESHTVEFTTGNNAVDAGNDFAFTQISNRADVGVSVMPLTGMRKGFNAEFLITIKNFGTTTLDGRIVFKIPANIATYSSSSETPVIIAPDSLVWDYTGLQPYESRNFSVSMHISIFTNTGTFFDAITYVTPIIGDLNVSNNIKIWNLQVVASCDPNEILVDRDTLTPAEALIPQELYYYIRFQNTGNDTAINVVIRDTLPPELNASTVEFLASSDPVRISYNNESRELTFTFDNIYLPDSTVNEPESHGAVSYRVKTAGNLNISDVVENQVDIYFDFNPPVATNTATTIVADPNVGFSFEKQPRFNIFPNPNAGTFEVHWPNRTSQGPLDVTVFDVLGKKIYDRKHQINSEKGTISIADLPEGIYLLTISSAGTNFHSQRIQVIK